MRFESLLDYLPEALPVPPKAERTWLDCYR